MNREIKFRAKPLSGGYHWVYGCAVIQISERAFLFENTDSLASVTPDGDIESSAYIVEGLIEVAPDTIGQYTGLKDKNGKEIYEGDIIRREAYGEFGPNIRVVFFDTESAGFVHQPIRYYAQKIKETLHDDFKSPFNKHITECYTIIGNVYDDKELLSQYVINN